MADPIDHSENPSKTLEILTLTRKEKRKAFKKLKRKEIRKHIALKEIEEEEARLNDSEEQNRIKLKEQEEEVIRARARREFEEREKVWLEAVAKRKEEEEERRRIFEESRKDQIEENELNEDDDGEYVEEGPAEIIWQGNEIIVKKKRVKVAKKNADQQPHKEDDDRPTSNPLPPQSTVFAAHNSASSVSSQQMFETVAQQIPNFGTEQDKAHCPFHIKTGACRFGSRCSRVHFYPDKSCTLLIKNMYSGPGLAWEQDEGLEYTEEEVDHCYEEFYEDVHTEFLKYGEIVNFKVCRNGSFHLRGNVYVHYKYLESAVLAYNSMNGRYFAGKQITCEFVGVTRWKVAICGEYMKSRFKICSRGTTCNFLHCFPNPGGDYEWADWDNPSPKYWVRKMVALFGPLDELQFDKSTKLKGHDMYRSAERKGKTNSIRSQARRSISHDKDWLDSGSEGDDIIGHKSQGSSPSSRRSYSISRRLANSRDQQREYDLRYDFDDYRCKRKHRPHDRGLDADQYELSQTAKDINSEDHLYSGRNRAGGHDHDLDRELSDSSSRGRSGGQRKKADFASQKESPIRYKEKKSVDHISVREYFDDNSDRHPSNSPSHRRSKSRRMKATKGSNGGNERSKEKNDIDDSGNYNWRHGTEDHNSYDDSRSNWSSLSRGKSPERKRSEAHERQLNNCGSHYHDHGHDTYKAKMPEAEGENERFSSDESSGKNKNGSDVERAYKHGGHHRSHQSSGRDKRERWHRKLEECERNVEDESGDSEKEKLKSESSSKKRSRTGSSQHQHSGRSRRGDS